MRMLLRMVIDAASGSDAIKSGALQKTIGNLIEKFKPESVYFASEDGMRAGYIVST